MRNPCGHWGSFLNRVKACAKTLRCCVQAKSRKESKGERNRRWRQARPLGICRN